MREVPKSLTALVHVKFNYQEPEDKGVSESEVEILSHILDQASNLPTEMQEILVAFANYLEKTSGAEHVKK
ncbi:MAG TPA: hypothetical protein VMW64_08065 [Dehalococcoidia bacterium]|nr:hypothetical protein [Dehalococcoidia bacterium]